MSVQKRMKTLLGETRPHGRSSPGSVTPASRERAMKQGLNALKYHGEGDAVAAIWDIVIAALKRHPEVLVAKYDEGDVYVELKNGLRANIDGERGIDLLIPAGISAVAQGDELNY